MMPAEFLAFFLYFWGLGLMARKSRTDTDFYGKLRFWSLVQGVLFVLFSILVFAMGNGFMTIYGATYLVSLALALGVTIRMRGTIEAGVETTGKVVNYRHADW